MKQNLYSTFGFCISHPSATITFQTKDIFPCFRELFNLKYHVKLYHISSLNSRFSHAFCLGFFPLNTLLSFSLTIIRVYLLEYFAYMPTHSSYYCRFFSPFFLARSHSQLSSGSDKHNVIRSYPSRMEYMYIFFMYIVHSCARAILRCIKKPLRRSRTFYIRI